MHIEKRTPDLLVLADSGAGARFIGAVFVAAGCFLAWNGAHGAVWQVIPIAFGSVFALIGVALVILPERVVAAFDKPTHTLSITRRTLRGYTRDEVDFSRITDVTTEASAGSRGGTTWRVAVVLRDGTHIPLTHMYSNSPLHAVAAKAAEDFLGITPAPVPAGPTTIFGGRTRPPPSRATVGFAIVFCSIFLVVGSWMLLSEWRKLTFYRPVTAEIVMSGYTEVHGKSTTYRPVVTYRYQVDGRRYASAVVTVLNESRSYDWAQAIWSRYPKGSSATAWYDPADPEKAFLVHDWSLLPLMFIAVPFVMLLSLAWTYRQIPRGG